MNECVVDLPKFAWGFRYRTRRSIMINKVSASLTKGGGSTNWGAANGGGSTNGGVACGQRPSFSSSCSMRRVISA